MGVERYDHARDKVGRPKLSQEKTFEAAPTFDNFFYHHSSTISMNQGEGGEIVLNIPPGNYEIEAHARLYNHSNVRTTYSCALVFFLDDFEREIWEGGEMGSTVDGRPYNLHFKTLASFKKMKYNKI